MDFGYYYNPAENQIRGGFWLEDPTPNDPNQVEVHDNYRDDSVSTTSGTPATTTARSTPSRGWPATWASRPTRSRRSTTSAPSAPSRDENCDYCAGPSRQPVGHYATYLGQRVFEGAYQYRGMKLIPTWGGSMFEALMVPLFVPEEKWGTKSWALTHPTYVRAQIEHGMNEAKYGYWGFSPSNNPAGGYREYGVDAIGMEPSGYASDQNAAGTQEGKTFVDYGYVAKDGTVCRPPQPEPTAVQPGCRHAARVVHRLPVRTGGRAEEPRQPAPRLRCLRPRRFLRRGQRHHRRDVRALPVPRPGHGDGRARQRARRRRHARGRSRTARWSSGSRR